MNFVRTGASCQNGWQIEMKKGIIISNVQKRKVNEISKTAAEALRASLWMQQIRMWERHLIKVKPHESAGLPTAKSCLLFSAKRF